MTEYVVLGFRNGIDGNERAECRVDSVKHSPSPSHREKARRAIDNKCFQSQSAATEHPLVRPPRRRVSQSVVFNTFTNSTSPIVALSASALSPPVLFPFVRITLNASATPGNSDTEQPLSYCYELPTQLRLESVANAHTAADLHVRSWVSYRAGQESLERRERVTNTPRGISDNP